jgi:chemotaxis family two-component system response regulator Rcp1
MGAGIMTSESLGRPMEILLVEDSLTDAGLTIEALKDGQVLHRLTLVRDGLEAVRFLRRRGTFVSAPRPDIILLDLELPKLHGREVLTEIKSDVDLKDIPVVVLTISEAHEELLKQQGLHVESYLTKPVEFEKFVAVIKEVRKAIAANVILPFIV